MKIILAILLLAVIGLSVALIKEREKYKTDLTKALDLAQTVTDRCQVAEDTLSIVFGREWNPDRLRMTEVRRVSAYTSRAQETDSTPNHTSTGERCRVGGVATTGDLGIPYGARILVASTGMVLTRNDFMPGKSGLDIWTPSLPAARQTMATIGDGPQTIIWMSEE